MTLNPSSVESLRRLFHEGFSARDIAEPLVSFDASNPVSEVREFMELRGYEIVGLRREGLVAGYVARDDLDEGFCGDHMHPFEPAQVVLGSTNFANLVARLQEGSRLFVSVLGHVSGIVSRTDLQKPPMRMWLFGMVTLIEMRFTTLIERHLPDEEWRQYLSAARLEKAEQLLVERSRRDQHLKVLDCLQFSDKGQIFARSQELRTLSRFESRRQTEDIVKRVERLRNNLAHSQDLSTDWETIVQLSENVDQVLEGPSSKQR